MSIFDDIKERFKQYIDHTTLCPFCNSESLIKNSKLNSNGGIATYWCLECGFYTMLSLLDKEATDRECIIYYKTLEYDIRKLKQELQEKENRLNKARPEILKVIVAEEL